jgi:hypothetical protein
VIAGIQNLELIRLKCKPPESDFYCSRFALGGKITVFFKRTEKFLNRLNAQS